MEMIMTKRKCIIIFLFAQVMCGILAAEAVAQNRILNVRHWVAPDYTRVVVDCSEALDYTVIKTSGHIRIDFSNTDFPKSLPQTNFLGKPGVSSISINSLSEGTISIELSLSEHKDATVFKLAKLDEKPHRVVIDIELPVIETKATGLQEPVPGVAKERVVVIDPGHGGEDPGAIGPRGTQEKDIVLKISLILNEIINKRPGYRAYLTRDGDYYVTFSKRLKLARDYGADLFLSIHADAAPNRQAYGASVYSLSTSGASTEAARLLALKENLADIMGGSPNAENNEASDPIVLNMYQTNTINTSKAYGQHILQNMARVIPLKYSTVQNAPFRVLKLPEIPSLLVETAYISNKNEEKLLRSGKYQMQIAEAIARSVFEILPVESLKIDKPVVAKQVKAVKAKENKHPSVEKAVAEATSVKNNQPVSRKNGQNNSNKLAVKYYKVQSGDTLGKIAKKHSTTMGALLRLNKMKLNDPLLTGREIIIEAGPADNEIRPTDKKRVAAKKKTEKFIYYRVKKGETLDLIARKNSTTVAELLQLNRMKPSDRLLADRRLKLPAPSSM